MTTPLLTTKLHIPSVRPTLVPRPRLIEHLNEGIRLGRKLTLISAPAGYGKTTLVSEWNQAIGGETLPIAVAWLSLDENDNDLTRFLSYFIAALQATEVNIGKGVFSTLHSPQPPPTEAILSALINEIAAIPGRIAFVLDDYHLIEAQPVHDVLTFLLQHLPPVMHLVVATRDDPPLPLARLRARGQLTELRATDLRFFLSEAAEFLDQVMGLDLSAEDIAALETRTEGWIAGLQLAAISMQGCEDATSLIKAFTGSHRYVLDYLIEEVLEQQPGNIQSFLMHPAVLNRLTGPLCDAVRWGFTATPTGQDNGQAILEFLEHTNLFIVPLDDERRWYRYHHLFADLLRQRLHQAQSEQLPILHNRASEWYEQNGLADEAIEHALRAKNLERAANMIEGYADDFWPVGEHSRLRRWLDGLPDEVIISKPHLCIFHSVYLLDSGQMNEAVQRLQTAEQALDPSISFETGTALIEPDQPLGPNSTKLLGRAAAAQARWASYLGDVQGIIQYARQALKYLPEQDLAWRSTAAGALGDAYSFTGDIEQAYRVRSEAIELSEAGGNIS